MKTLAAMTSPPTSRRSPAAPAAPDQLVGVHERGVGMRAKTDISRGSVGGDVPVGDVPDAVHLTVLAGVVVDRVGTTGD
jgi:hypothetical protein